MSWCLQFPSKLSCVNLLLFSFLYLKMQIGKVHKKSLWSEIKTNISQSRFWLKIAFSYLTKHSLRKIFFLQTHLAMLLWRAILQMKLFLSWQSDTLSSLNTLLFISCCDNGVKIPKVILKLLSTPSINLGALKIFLRKQNW